MLAQTLNFLVTALGDLFASALLARFLLQWVRAPARNPLSDFLAAVTNFAVLPARRLIPGLWGLDLATLVVAWFVLAVQLAVVLVLRGIDLGALALGPLALLAVLSAVRLTLYLVIGALIVQAILSWVNPYSPIAPLVNSVARPFLRPFQRLLPPIANVDLSPLFALLACQLLLSVPLAWGEGLLQAVLVQTPRP